MYQKAPKASSYAAFLNAATIEYGPRVEKDFCSSSESPGHAAPRMDHWIILDWIRLFEISSYSTPCNSDSLCSVGGIYLRVG